MERIVWVDPLQWKAERHVIAATDTAQEDGILIYPPGMWENEQGPADHFAVSDVDGIFAYAADEATAEELQKHFSETAKRETIEEHVTRNR